MASFDDDMGLEQALRAAVELRERIAARTNANREDTVELKALKEAIEAVMEDEEMDRIDDVPGSVLGDDGAPAAMYLVTRGIKTEFPSKASIMEAAIQQFLAEGNAFAWGPAMEYVEEYRKARGDEVCKVTIRKKKPKKPKDEESTTVAFDELRGGDETEEAGPLAGDRHGPPRV